MTPNLVHHFLEHSADTFPDKVALIHEDIRATYSEINSQANQLACWLLSQGIKKCDRVVFIFENCLEYVVSYYGTLKAGAVAVPLNSDLKPDGLLPLLKELEPEVIILSSRFERLLRATDLSSLKIQTLIIKKPKLDWAAYPLKIIEWSDIIQEKAVPNPELQIDQAALASIIYTSGSTGKPKGVMLSHGNIVANAQSICSYLKITPNDIQMVVLPFHYVMGKSLLNTHMAAGATVVINNKFAFPATVVTQMVEENVTAFSGVPSTYAYLLHRSPLKKYRDRLPSLRYCSQAGGHMSNHIKRELRKALPPHTEIFIMYGATEASARLTYLEPGKYDEKMGSIGKAIPGVTMRVLDDRGSEVPVGQTGELVGAGSNIMQGYWRNPEATTTVLSPDGYHTGDFGYQDPDGFFYVTGRRDELLKVGGHRVNLLEIEDAILATGQVLEAVVLGIPDPLLGNRLAAMAVAKNGDCAEKEILARCVQKLPKYKLPGEIRLIRSLPKNSSGKIDRTKCVELMNRSNN